MRGVYIASLEGGDPVRVLDAGSAAYFAPPRFLLRTSQGALIAQSFDVERATGSGEPVVVAQGVGQDDGTYHSAFSASTVRVIAHRGGAASRRQLHWSDRGGVMPQPLGGATDERVLLSTQQNKAPVDWSSDGGFAVVRQSGS